jgi:hypothetical protein
MKEHGINSEAFKAAAARLAEAIRNLPKPIDTSEWKWLYEAVLLNAQLGDIASLNSA